MTFAAAIAGTIAVAAFFLNRGEQIQRTSKVAITAFNRCGFRAVVIHFWHGSPTGYAAIRAVGLVAISTG
jgi:hypothetical protein